MLAALFSGGKDSTLAAIWATMQGFDVTLITIKPKPYSMLFHHPNLHLTPIQAKLMGLKHKFVASKGKDEEALKKALKGFEGVVSGAIESEYQRRIIEEIAEGLGIPSYAPLWHKGVLEDVSSHMEAYVSAVSADGLGKECLAKKFPVNSLPKGVHPAFEGGEGETLVCYAPLFSKRIVVGKWRIEWDGIRGVASAEKWHLLP
ncbi:MAG: diphthine--ammonia ligase [Candidatus Anstonellales archaeon]